MLVYVYGRMTCIGESISCLQCVTLRDEGCDDGTLNATECRANNSHCITYVGTVRGSKFILTWR